MKNNNTRMLKPVDVSSIYPVKSKSKKGDRLKGFKVTVTYDGFAWNSNKKKFGAGILSGGYGSRLNSIVFDVKKEQTVAEYFFRNGPLFPEPFGRAGNFHGIIQGMIKDFNPVDVSQVEPYCQDDLFGCWYISGYSVTVSYPKSAQDNPVFKKFVTHHKPNIVKIGCDWKTGLVDVEYFFKRKRTAELEDFYRKACNFQELMSSQIKKQDENIK